jgi:hypothetical protein
MFMMVSEDKCCKDRRGFKIQTQSALRIVLGSILFEATALRIIKLTKCAFGTESMAAGI